MYNILLHKHVVYRIIFFFFPSFSSFFICGAIIYNIPTSQYIYLYCIYNNKQNVANSKHRIDTESLIQFAVVGYISMSVVLWSKEKKKRSITIIMGRRHVRDVIYIQLRKSPEKIKVYCVSHIRLNYICQREEDRHFIQLISWGNPISLWCFL